MIRLPPHIDEVLRAGGTVVVPSRQRAHALRVAHAAAQLAEGRRVWPSADVLPLEGWLTREIERCAAAADSAGHLPRLLTPAEEWLLWREGTAEAAGHLELVNGAALAAGLRAARRLALEVQLDLRALRAAPGTETALFLEVHQAVEARSRALGAASAAALLPRIAALGDDRPLLLSGFPGVSPLVRLLAAARQASGRETQWARLEPPSGTPQVVMPADELEELDHIAAWCRGRLVAHPDDRLLIVLPGPPGRRERLAALIQQALDPRGAFGGAEEGGALVSLEGGGALSGQPAVAHALESLALLCGEAMELERLAQWLLAPFWSEPALEGRARLELWLRERSGLTLDRPAFQSALKAAPGPLEAAARSCATQLDRAELSLRHASGSPREWSERFRGALQALGWPGAGALSSLEQQTQLRFHELLDEFGQLSAALGALTRRAAFERLKELAAETSYRPADEDAVITLTAALADPVVRYDAVWVAGLHAEAFPQPVAPDPFVPLAAQLAAGSPGASATGRLAEAHSLLAAWRAAAGELVLSSPRRSGDLDLLPSPLLAQWAGGAAHESGQAEPVWLALRAHRADRCEPWEDAGLPWDTREPLPAGTRSIELQNLCPFRAYAELRLGCTELTESEPGVAPDFRGRLLHAALQRLWSALRDSRSLIELTQAELDERIAQSVSGALEEQLDGDEAPPSGPALARERRRTERLMRQLLDLERQRSAFTVRHTEYAAHIDLEGIRLRVRMDRIDALEGGGLAILDYKSGRPVSLDWYGERPSHPQLLTYLTAFGEEVHALATVNVTAREVRFQGIAAEANLLPRVAGVKGPERAEAPWPARVREWGDVVRRLARDFAAGVATVDPKPGACDYCPVSSVCRIGDAPARDAVEAVTGEGE